MADEKEPQFVHPNDGGEHGYWGKVPDTRPNEDYTVAGVTKDTSTDTKSSSTTRAKRSTAS